MTQDPGIFDEKEQKSMVSNPHTAEEHPAMTPLSPESTSAADIDYTPTPNHPSSRQSDQILTPTSMYDVGSEEDTPFAAASSPSDGSNDIQKTGSDVTTIVTTGMAESTRYDLSDSD